LGRRASVPGPYVFVSFTIPYGVMEKIENIMEEEKINNRSELLRTLLLEGLKVHESRKHRRKGKEVEKHGDC